MARSVATAARRLGDYGIRVWPHVRRGIWIAAIAGLLAGGWMFAAARALMLAAWHAVKQIPPRGALWTAFAMAWALGMLDASLAAHRADLTVGGACIGMLMLLRAKDRVRTWQQRQEWQLRKEPWRSYAYRGTQALRADLTAAGELLVPEPPCSRAVAGNTQRIAEIERALQEHAAELDSLNQVMIRACQRAGMRLSPPAPPRHLTVVSDDAG